MSSPTVSVVVPVYNGAEYLAKTITTILDQSFTDFELILVNDGSSDTSADLIDSFKEKDERVKTHHKENGGVACARNFGIQHAEGEFIAFCDQDDLWHPDKLEKQLPLFENPDVGLVYCGALIEFTNLNKVSKPSFKRKFRGEVFDRLIQQNMITCCSAIARKSVLKEVCGFDDDRNLMGVDDWHLWLKLALHCQVDLVEEYLCTHIFHGDNYSLNDQKMHDAEIVCLDKIAPLAEKEGRQPNWRLIKNQLHIRYAQSYIYTGDFSLAAKTYQRAYKEQSSLPILLRCLFYNWTPDFLLHYLQKNKRKLAN
ncbi:glycosyltransferase [Motiliproteus sp. MSK22-1]|uniref:glycosyltransferase n=1 Tax=Motiliproteus sp. MSK22-1 TaxID=1897630 RepID=UPI000977E948|nr:glycosyltransferase [Motiliproteus sp. MSK22-1]OMH25675.1 hypothetical protein BGP75_24335 [Motiliproteus sp. MSK22-1]